MFHMSEYRHTFFSHLTRPYRMHVRCTLLMQRGSTCQGRRQGGGLWGAEAPPPPKRGMGAHARGADRGIECSWCGGGWRVEKCEKLLKKKKGRQNFLGREFWRLVRVLKGR
jgi:hypothetical protein